MTLLLAAALGLLPSSARAEDPPELPASVTTSAGIRGERMTMPAKRAMLHTSVEINLSAGAAGKPFSIAPDLWYGVSDKLTVGLVHSVVASSGVMGGFGSSLCLSGSDVCDVYNGLGLDARYHLKAGKLSVAADGGLFVNNLDPFQLALKLGVVGRYRMSAKLAIDIAPNLVLGLTERDGVVVDMVASGANKEVLTLPATAMYALQAKLALAVQTGIVVPFEATGDTFFVPLSLGAAYQLSPKMSLDAAFTLLNLVGGGALATGFDTRSFTIGVGYAL